MPMKCVLYKCRSGYIQKKDEPPENVKQPVFSFPDKNKYPDLRNKWIKFVNCSQFRLLMEYVWSILIQNSSLSDLCVPNSKENSNQFRQYTTMNCRNCMMKGHPSFQRILCAWSRPWSNIYIHKLHIKVKENVWRN